ncbi:MAG: twin-arginine translocase subunit TatC [Arcobacteraceae bacterium]|jgi:sec-independent protein translocase protein TatC
MFQDLKPHLADLQKRLIIIALTLLVMFFVCFSFYEPILNWILAPVEAALPTGSHMIAVELGETFFTALMVSFFAAFFASLPVIFWQLWLFLAPGLYSNEKRILVPFVVGASVMFSAGALFSYYIVVPLGFAFLIDFGSTVVSVTPSIGAYVSFFIKIVFGFGIAFELPVITFFFAVVGLVNDQMMKDFFRYAVVLIFIIAALLTPPDVVSQMLMAMPLLVLYVISIYIAKIFNPADKVEEHAEEDEE